MTPQAPPTVLVVDDAPVTRELLAAILRSEGCRALAAADAPSAWEECGREAVDLILLDVGLPGKSGLELCADLKRNPATSDTPVIVVSAHDDPGSRVAGFRAGCVDYIAKPFYAREMMARVRVHLRLHQTADRLMRQERERAEELRDAQRSMLVEPEDVPQARFAVSYHPLDAVGGDMYDVMPLSGDRLGYFVADISGHGVAASLMTVVVKTLLRQYSSPSFSVEETMRNMNAVMRSTLTEGRYATACYALLSADRRTLSAIGGGHPPLILVPERGRGRVLHIEGNPLGVFGTPVFQKREIETRPGDRFYLYTDGLIEDPGAPGGGREAGIHRLRVACERRRRMPIAEAVRAIVDDVRPPGSPLNDDLLLLGAEIAPPGRWTGRRVVFERGLAATLEEVDRVCAELRAGALRDIPGSERFALELLLREALTNAVQYGVKEPAGEVRCEIESLAGGMALRVSDTGRGFPWRERLRLVPPPLAESGRGLQILTRYSSELRFNEEGNQVEIVRMFGHGGKDGEV